MELSPEIIECKYSRSILGLIAFLLLPVLLFISMHGLLAGFHGLLELNTLLIAMGLANVLGLTGFIAAIYRLFKNIADLTKTQILIIRYMLICGVLSSTLLVIACIYSGMPIAISLLCLFLACVGLVFLYVTPNKQIKRDF